MLTIFFNFSTNHIVRYWHIVVFDIVQKRIFRFVNVKRIDGLNIFSRHCYARQPRLRRFEFVRWILIVLPETIEKKQKLSRTLPERLALPRVYFRIENTIRIVGEKTLPFDVLNVGRLKITIEHIARSTGPSIRRWYFGPENISPEGKRITETIRFFGCCTILSIISVCVYRRLPI